MVWKCSVPNCKISERKNPDKLSCFSVPSDSEERQKWGNILGYHLKDNMRVCEKHFSTDNIKSRYYGEHNGIVLLNVSKYFQCVVGILSLNTDIEL